MLLLLTIKQHLCKVKKIKTVKDFLKSYYDKNLERLQKDYPGLPLNRFIDEYCEFDNSSSTDEFFMENPAFFEKIRLGVPLEYINYKSYFYSNEFYVNQDVLIPRSETEILVEEAINFINKSPNTDFSMIDIGTGSGCIPLTIACEVKRPISITATDLSGEAIEVAKINYDHLVSKFTKGTSVDFKLTDRLKGIDQKFDLILSNPPYIKFSADKEGVHNNVDSYEPHMALYLRDEDYDNWFNTLFSQVTSSLNNNGLFIMEGHESNLKALAKTANEFFSDISIKQDYTQRDRFLFCRNC